MKLITQSISLLLACFLVLVITNTPLADYTAPILGFLIIVSVIFIIVKQRTTKNKGDDIFVGSNKEVFMVTTALLLAVFMTGGLNSSLYFLLYFLLFGIVFLFEPPTVFVLLLGLVIVFFQQMSDGDLFSNVIKLGSLAFLSPISYFFGREFQRRAKLEQEIEDKAGQIIENAETLKEHTQNENAIDEINDIIDKSKELQKEAETDE
ncbi:MAG TPA: hypothetical protein VHE53_01080 [Patescibacteria group bacterium]|nr:hypothetical protein [Patescibacteria group bacterium]